MESTANSAFGESRRKRPHLGRHRLALILIIVLAVLAGSSASTPIAQDTYVPWYVVAHGGASGGDAVYIPRGDILNVRNIQGGGITDPNFDLGAGSAARRGVLSLNYDVGKAIVAYDGYKRAKLKISSFGVFVRRNGKWVRIGQ